MNPVERERWADRQVATHPSRAARTARLYTEDGASEKERELGDALAAALDRAKRCRACGRILEDPVSIARKLGSDCWDKENAA